MAKGFVVVLLLSSVVLAAPPIQESVEVKLGPKKYRDGDVVEIRDVTATSSSLEQGDSITVRGRVRLESQKKAVLCLLVTQTEGNGSEESDPGQSIHIEKGLHEFTLKATIKHRGHLHLTLYDEETSKPIGGTYFGKPGQLKQIETMSVNHYLNK